jgi:BMFP domain-containing protein YqiC
MNKIKFDEAMRTLWRVRRQRMSEYSEYETVREVIGMVRGPATRQLRIDAWNRLDTLVARIAELEGDRMMAMAAHEVGMNGGMGFIGCDAYENYVHDMMDDLRGENTELRARIAELEGERKAEHRHAVEMEGERDDAYAEINALQAENTELKARLDMRQRAIDEYVASLNAPQGEHLFEGAYRRLQSLAHPHPQERILPPNFLNYPAGTRGDPHPQETEG